MNQKVMQILAKSLMANLKDELGIVAEKWLDRNYEIVVRYAQKNLDSDTGVDLLKFERGLISKRELAMRVSQEYTYDWDPNMSEFHRTREEFELMEAQVFANWLKNSSHEIALLAGICPDVADIVDSLEPDTVKIDPTGVGTSIFNELGRISQEIQVSHNDLN